jgi:hypothetical protein
VAAQGAPQAGSSFPSAIEPSDDFGGRIRPFVDGQDGELGTPLRCQQPGALERAVALCAQVGGKQ